MLYMIIEDFRDGDAIPVYRRLRDRGRQTPDGLSYLTSWVTTDLSRCYQVMECENRELLDEWLSRWADLVSFEVLPVISASEASARMAPRL